MAQTTGPLRFSFPMCVALLLLGGGPAAADPKEAAGKHSLAGQVCPSGSFVIGFDAEGDIMCSATCGNGVLNPDESCDDGNTRDGDGCSAACRSEAATVASTAAVTTEAAPTAAAAAATAAGLVLSDIEPSSVVYGTRELAITILGSGFDAQSVIEFAGKTYTPEVNPEGTRANVTLATRNLTLGSYAVTVSNPSGEKKTLKRAVVVY